MASEPNEGANSGVPDHDRREATLTEINYGLNRQTNDRRLYVVRRLIQTPGARVFVPRSAAGANLFSRIVDLDAIYARCEQKLWRRATSDAMTDKQELERQLMELNTTLVDIAAHMAVTHGVEDKGFDAAVVARVRDMRAQAKASSDTPSAATSKPRKERVVNPVVVEPPPAEVTTAGSATSPA